MSEQNPTPPPQQHNNGLSWQAPAQPKPAAPAPAVVPQAPQAAPQAAAPKSSGGAAKLTGWLAAGIVAGVVLAWAGTAIIHKGPAGALPIVAQLSQNTTTTTAANTGAGQGSDANLTVASPQKAGLSVAIEKAVVSAPTWVAVYESRDGKPGNVLGATLFFPGTQSGTVELLRGTVAGQTYFVTRQSDNGDHKFSKTDPVLTENGQAQWVSFVAN